MRKIAVCAGMAVAISAGALAFTAGTASASTSTDQPVQIVNNNSGKCLEIADWRTDNGAPARQWDCTGGANQKWYVYDIDPGNYGYTYAYKLVNAYSGKCLEVADWRTDDGAPVRQWDCTNGANQQWLYGSQTITGTTNWQNLNSGRCVVTQGLNNGSTAFQYDCGTWADQEWTTR